MAQAPVIPTKLDRMRSILSDTSFVEAKARSLVRKVFAEEEIKIEALLIQATRAKLTNISNLFEKLDLIEKRFFEPRTINGESRKLVDVMAPEDLLELYKTLAKTMTDLYRDIQDDVSAISSLETANKNKDPLNITKEQKEALRAVVDKVLVRISLPVLSSVTQ